MKRETWIDMAKGYGMLLVILGHLYQKTPWLMTIIYSCHVPLFFFMSGYLFKVKDVKSFLKTIVFKFIIPYISVGIPVVIMEAIRRTYLKVNHLPIDVNLLRELKKLLLQNRYTTLWFFACLLVIEIMVYVILKLCRHQFLQHIGVLLVFGGGIAYLQDGGQSVPLNVDAAAMMVPFFYAGYLMKTHKLMHKLFTHKYISLIIFLAIYSYIYRFMMTSGTLVLDVYHNVYGNMLLTYLWALDGILVICLVSSLLDYADIAYIGQYSLTYFAWHQTIGIRLLRYVPEIKMLLKYPVTGYWLGNLLMFFIVMCVIKVVNELIIHTPLRFMIGLSS